MASNNIKGLTVEIGGDVSKLTDALKSTDAKIKNSSSELRELDKLLKLDPTNTELLAQKQQVLSESIDATKSRLERLRTAQEQAEPRLQNYDKWKQKNDDISGSIEKAEKALLKLREQQEAVADADGADSTQYKVLSAQITDAEAKLKALRKEQKSWFDECGRPVSPESYRALQREIASTEQKLQGLVQQSDDTAKSTKDLEKTADGAADSVEDMGKSAEKAGNQINDSAKQADDAAKKTADLAEENEKLKESYDDAKESAKKAGIELGALVTAGSAIVGAGIAAATSYEDAMASLQIQTGASDAEMRAYEDTIGAVFRSGLGEDLDDISTTMATIAQTTRETDPSKLKALAENALTLRDSFGFETAEQMRAVDMLMTQFGISSESAYNLIAQGAQNGLNRNGDLMDVINEYSVHYRQLGYTADEFFGSLINGAESGTFSVDKLGDAMKEFGIRAKDTSTTTTEAYESLGLDADIMREKIAAGGETAKSASETILTALLGVDDQVLQNQIGVSLFGTMWEDLGVDAIRALTNVDSSLDATKSTMQDIKDIKYNTTATQWKQLGRIAQRDLIAPLGEKLLPMAKKLLSYCITNGDKILSLIKRIGPILASMLVGSKISKMTDATVKLVQSFKKLKTATDLANTSMAATPVGAIGAAAGAVIGIIGELVAAAQEEEEMQERLSEAYRNAADAAIAAQQERADAAHLIDEEYDGYRDLMKELDAIVDANGKIKTGYEERAAFITGKLSEAAGIEIEITDGVIQKYSELSNMLDTILIKKQAEALLTSQQGDYQTAKSAIGSTETDEDGNYIAGSQAAYEAANNEYQNAVKTVEAYDRGMRYFKNRIDVLDTLLASGAIDNNTYTYRQQQIAIDRRIFEDKYKDYDYVFDTAKLDQKKQIADDARLAYDAYIAVIDNYENLQTAVWSEDTDAMRDAIVDASNAQMKAGKASLASLKQQRDNAIESYNTYLEWSRREESSVSPADIAEKRNQALQAALEVHQQMLNESTQHTEEELEASKLEIETALSEIGGLTDKQISTILRLMETGGFDAGKFFGEGIIAGMSSTETKIFEAGGRLGNAGMAGYNLTMEIASPSKRARRSGRFTGLGVALGLEDEVETVAGKAVLLADAIAAELDGDLPMHAVTIAQGGYFKRGDSIDSLGESVSIEAVFARLDAILTAVREIDPCMVLDDGTIVAKTAEKTNDALGIIATRERRGRF